jgi:hypothetical protein
MRARVAARRRLPQSPSGILSPMGCLLPILLTPGRSGGEP